MYKINGLYYILNDSPSNTQTWIWKSKSPGALTRARSLLRRPRHLSQAATRLTRAVSSRLLAVIGTSCLSPGPIQPDVFLCWRQFAGAATASQL
jgi:hypothetical protein